MSVLEATRNIPPEKGGLEKHGNRVEEGMPLDSAETPSAICDQGSGRVSPVPRTTAIR